MGGQQRAICKSGDNQFFIEEGDTFDLIDGQVCGVQNGLPGFAQDLEGKLFGEEGSHDR